MKSKTPSFHLKGYERVMAIHKIKQSINKFGDKLGKKHNILNNIKRKNNFGGDFIKLSINTINRKEKRQSLKLNLLNKKIQNNEEEYKNGKNENLLNNNINKEEDSSFKIISGEEKIKLENDNEILNSSYDCRLKEADIFPYNKKGIINKLLINNFSTLNRNRNKNIDFSYLIENMKKSGSIKKNKTYNNFFSSLINNQGSPIEKTFKYANQDQIANLNTKYNNTKYNNLLDTNKKIIPKLRDLKLGTKHIKMKLNCKILKLGRNFSTGNINQNNTTIKTRNLFYNKYQKKKAMKLKKIKFSKSQSELIDNESSSYNRGEKFIAKYNTKNFGQQTPNCNMNKTNTLNFNLLKIYSYIRLPNINRINYPEKNLHLDNNDFGVNFDFYNNNYFYLKDLKNQSINKIYMINPFIRNRIINYLKEK